MADRPARRRSSLAGLLIVPAILSVAVPGTSQESTGRVPVPRASRPTFDERQVRSDWFENLVDQALVGTRPDSLGRVVTVGGAGNGSGSGTSGSGDSAGPAPAPAGFDWSTLIGADVIEDQVKQVKLSTDANVTTPNKFAGGGYAVSRADFSVLAMLFAIVHEYPTQVRWKNDAPALRDAFARAAANCKTGSPQAYNEAKLRKQDLTDIVGGNSFSGAAPAEPVNDWATICDRAPLMERLQSAIDRLKEATSSEAAFQSKLDEIRAEAAMTAAIGHVLTLEGMEDSGESSYAEISIEMRDAATSLGEAVRNSIYDQAVSAVGRIGQSCDRCHNDWR